MHALRGFKSYFFYLNPNIFVDSLPSLGIARIQSEYPNIQVRIQQHNLLALIEQLKMNNDDKKSDP